MTAAYVIKAAIADPGAAVFDLPNQKTMYGGKLIAPGDTAYVFASETEGGAGLIARGTVIRAEPVPPLPFIGRQVPRLEVQVRRTDRASRPFGRADLKPFGAWKDGQPQTELNFKFYRQATNKIGGISPAAAAFLDTIFAPATSPRLPSRRIGPI